MFLLNTNPRRQGHLYESSEKATAMNVNSGKEFSNFTLQNASFSSVDCII
jgi:hypothetical protein